MQLLLLSKEKSYIKREVKPGASILNRIKWNILPLPPHPPKIKNEIARRPFSKLWEEGVLKLSFCFDQDCKLPYL